MYQYTVSNMTCGHCAGAISKAIAATDQVATVSIDIAKKSVSVDSQLPETAIRQAIIDAGYEAIPA